MIPVVSNKSQIGLEENAANYWEIHDGLSNINEKIQTNYLNSIKTVLTFWALTLDVFNTI